MTDHKFTDDEIIKGLGVLAAYDCKRCLDLGHDCFGKDCDKVIAENALALITRQKAEIERLERIRAELSRTVESLTNESLTNKCADCAGCAQWVCDCSTIESEAIKEFAERLKVKVGSIPQYHFNLLQVEDDIDTLVKEMTEE